MGLRSVKSSVKRFGLLLISGVVVASCAGPFPDARTPGGEAGESDVGDTEHRTVEIYAVVVRRLVTKDHTFGDAPSPFKHVYILDGAVRNASDPTTADSKPQEPFSEGIKRGLRDKLADLPRIAFISDPDVVRVDDQGIGEVKNEGVIITLGPIVGDGNNVEVPNALWCGSLCGQWLTYVVEHQGGDWEISGTTGPTAIS